MHGLSQHLPGVELPTWATSKTAVQMKELVEMFHRFQKDQMKMTEALEDECYGVRSPETGMRTESNRKGEPCLESRYRVAKDRWMAAEHVAASGKKDAPSESDVDAMHCIVDEVRDAMDAKVRHIDELTFEVIKKRRDLNNWMDARRDIRFSSYPWGGLCLDQKGLFWQTLVKMFEHYGRDADLCLLQTRPNWASELWTPPATLNLLSCDDVPANTYATAIVKTAQAIAGGEGDKGFFKVQAEKNIGAAISLMRAIAREQRRLGWEPERICYPALDRIHDILTSQEDFLHFLRINKVERDPDADKAADLDKTGSGVSTVTRRRTQRMRPEVMSADIQRWKIHFAERYWKQPAEQLGGVMGTIQNYLGYFCSTEIAEVFCRQNTFELSDIEKGKVICLSMPQKLQVERRYVSTLLKILVLQQAQRRFDLRNEELEHVNLVAIFQDEAQRFVIEEDKDVDTLRQAVVTSILATQDIPSLFPPLGGKDKALPILLNLRNRMIGKAADTEGAKASSEFIGQSREVKIQNFNRSLFGLFRAKKQWKEEYEDKIHAAELRAVPDFTFYVTHSEGHMRQYVIKPLSATGGTPRWWRGAVWRTRRYVLAFIVFLTPFAPSFWEVRIPKAAKNV
jgi:hypothetical protein